MRRRAILIGVLAALAGGPAAAAGGGSGAPDQAPASRQERLTSAESLLPQPNCAGARK
jgi:hypothetical protein